MYYQNMINKIQALHNHQSIRNKQQYSPRSFSLNQISNSIPSITYLSSLFQLQKKKKINKQLLDFTRRFSSTSHTERNHLTPTQHQQHKITQIIKRQIKTSEHINKRKISQDQIFLSQITDQECPSNTKDLHIMQLTKQLSRKKRRNFNMRKLQFHQYVKASTSRQPSVLQEKDQVKQIIYERQRSQRQNRIDTPKRIHKKNANPHIFAFQ